MGDLVVSYADAVAAGPGVVGGKAWNLGQLHRNGFPVPAGGAWRAWAWPPAEPAGPPASSDIPRTATAIPLAPEGERAG